MRIAIVPYGSRGDAQPLIVVGHELVRRGHRVRLVGARTYGRWAQAAGLEQATFDLDADEIMRTDEAKRVMASGKSLRLMRWLAEIDARFERPYRELLVEALEGVDVVIAHQSAVERVAVVAAKRRLPVLPFNSMPFCPTSEFSHPLLRLPALGLGSLRRLSGKLFLRVWWRSAEPGIQAFRSELGLAPGRSFYQRVLRERAPMMTSQSLAILPRPHDWHDDHATPGQIRMSSELRAAFGESTLPPALDRWLDAGVAPIYCGFGSLPVLDPVTMLAAARDVAHALGARVVVSAGWSKLDTSTIPTEGDEHVIVVGSVDHDWLFPRCAAAVHHGGIGTVNASLGAGLATMICSVWLDQPFWGERLARLGVGHTVPFAKLTTRRLIEGVSRLLDDEMRRRARELGGQVANEDGTRVAADACERLLPRALIPD